MFKVTQLHYSWDLGLKSVAWRLRTGAIIVVLRSVREPVSELKKAKCDET